MGRVLGTPVTFTSGHVALVWHGHGVATALDSYANNGLQVAFIGATLADWKGYAVSGNDVPPFPYGKWVNNPVDPSLTAQTSNGTPPTGGTSIYGIGSICELTQSVAKGQPHVCDMIRYGRAEARINGGQAANYATFAGFAALNDAQTARWGLIQAVQGGYQWKGLMTLGFTSLVDFRDSNVSIFVQDCRKVSATFNAIEVRQATSRVDWTGVSITCASPATTASKGSFACIDNADINFDICTFTDMSTFAFQSASTVLSTTFRRCGQVTSGGGVLTGCLFDSSTNTTGALLINSATEMLAVTSCDFKTNAKAVKITAAGTYTFDGHQFTGNTVQVDFTGAGTCTINPTNGCNVIQADCTASGGGTIVVNAAQVTLKVTVLSDATSNPLQYAHVYLIKTSDSSQLMNGATDVNGIYQTTMSYTGIIDVRGWVRQMDLSGTDYEQKDISGQVTSGGFLQTVRLTPI